jgi:hypothetical protein
MTVGDLILWVTDNWWTLLNLGTQIIGVGAIIASMTPNRADDKIVQMLLDLVNFSGFNFGGAKNRD